MFEIFTAQLTLIKTLILFLIAFIIASLPLYLAVKFLGGRTSILKVIGVHFIVAVVIAFIQFFINILAGLIAFIAMLWIYKEMFQLGWLRAFLAWILSIIIAVILVIILISFVFII
jgi:hypothetical protein